MTQVMWPPPAPEGKEKGSPTQCNRYPSAKAFAVSKIPLNCFMAVGTIVSALVS